TRNLAFKPHLRCTMLAQKLLGGPCRLWRTLDPDTVIAVTETWIVADHHRESRNARADEKTRDGRQRSDENHHLEAEDRVRDPGSDRFAADNERPVIRCPDRD